MRHPADLQRFLQVKTHLAGGLMRYCMKRTGHGQPDSCAERGGMTAMKPTITFDDFVRSPISALRVSLVTAAYDKYASLLGIRKP